VKPNGLFGIFAYVLSSALIGGPKLALLGTIGSARRTNICPAFNTALFQPRQPIEPPSISPFVSNNNRSMAG
jgi:hypothetical protein